MNENVSQEYGDPVYIPTGYFIVAVHDMCMTCMCGYVCSAHVYDHRTTVEFIFSSHLYEGSQRSNLDHQAYMPPPLPTQPSCQSPI